MRFSTLPQSSCATFAHGRRVSVDRFQCCLYMTLVGVKGFPYVLIPAGYESGVYSIQAQQKMEVPTPNLPFLRPPQSSKHCSAGLGCGFTHIDVLYAAQAPPLHAARALRSVWQQAVRLFGLPGFRPQVSLVVWLNCPVTVAALATLLVFNLNNPASL